MRFHHITSNLYFRFIIIFLGAFAVSVFTLNGRFVAADLEYIFNPNTLYSPDKITPLPVSANLLDKPLPDQATLIIDKIRVEAPIVFNVPAKNKTIFDNLEQGVVHYSITPKPGERGTAVILGHSSAYPWYRGNYGSVFALLIKLAPGDRFQVRYSDGRTLTFQMTQSLVFNPFTKDEAVLAQLEQSNKPSIILLSCWPVGTDYKRLAIKAELVQ